MASKRLKSFINCKTHQERLEVYKENKKIVNKYIPIYKRYFKIISKGVDIDIAEYDGGNDSGNINISIDVPDDDLLQEIFYILLEDYGSWAGDYSANGTISYNYEENCFEADGSESVTEWIDFNNKL